MDIDNIENNEETIIYFLKAILRFLTPHPSTLALLSGNGPLLQINYNNPIQTPKSGNYGVGLETLSTYNSIPNIDETNNLCKISFDEQKTWKQITIPVGCYELDAINNEIQIQIVTYGGKKDVLQIKPNLNTLKCMVIITETPKYSIDFRGVNSLRDLLGLSDKIYNKAREMGTNIVEINKISQILVHCNLVPFSRNNNTLLPLIYSFYPDVAPGSKIYERPLNPVYFPINIENIYQIRVWITDQDGNLINLSHEELSICLQIKSLSNNY